MTHSIEQIAADNETLRQMSTTRERQCHKLKKDQEELNGKIEKLADELKLLNQSFEATKEQKRLAENET